MILYDPKSREEWLRCRSQGIGGSQAGTAIGKNKYMTNVELWEIKTHRKQPDDLSDKPAVQYGKNAEEHIRAMFSLDYPEYDIDYHEFRMYANNENPWLYATLDGELTGRITKTKGILEIKTATIMNSMQWKEWDNKIPDSYYIQLLHQLLATGWDFAVLRAYIRHYNREGELVATVKDYMIDRVDVEEDMEYLLDKEKEFWQYVIDDKRPPLILPELKA